MIQTQPLEVKDFSLGITDYYIDGIPAYAKTMQNLFLTSNQKLQTAWGSENYDGQLPLGTTRVNKISRILGNIIGFQDKRAYRDNAGAWAEIQGPAAGVFMPAGSGTSIITDTEWQGHIFFASDSFCSPQKLFIDQSGVYKVRNAGMPVVPAGVAITNPVGAGESYLYSFILAYTYQVDTVVYLDLGPVYEYPTAVTGGVISGGNTVTITLPTTIAVPENWDVANFKIQIYRTASNASTFFLLTELAFGTATYIDNNTDASIIDNTPLYTTGGVLSNDTPPKAKYVHVVNGFGYWAHIKDGSEILSTEVRQSKDSDPDSVPGAFNVNTETPIRGLSSIFDRPVVLCDRYIYRIDNFFANDATGGMLLRRIDDKAGCASAQSVVQTHVGLFWAGEHNFYWTDGYRVESISNHLNKSFKSWVLNDTRKSRIVGTFEPSEQRVVWTVCSNGNEPDTTLVMDLRLPFLPDGQARKGATFTTQGGVAGDTNFTATQVLANGNYIYRGDTRGYIMRHSSDLKTDPKVDTTTAATNWQKATIRYLYESCFLDFGSKFVRKWVPRILISAGNTTNLSLGISSSNDNNRVTGDLKPIRYRSNITWGDELPLWGDPDALWNKQGLIEQWRRFPAGGLRCNYKQIILKNALVKVVDSDLLGTVTVNSSTKTATLGGSHTWLTDLVDYYISFANDNFSRNFLITARTATTITYSDASNAGPSTSGVYKWIIRGYPKGEVLLLNGYVVHWAYLSKSHTPFSTSSLGGTP